MGHSGAYLVGVVTLFALPAAAAGQIPTPLAYWDGFYLRLAHTSAQTSVWPDGFAFYSDAEATLGDALLLWSAPALAAGLDGVAPGDMPAFDSGITLPEAILVAGWN